MATLSEYNAKGGVDPNRRGVISPNLGAYKPVMASEEYKPKASNVQQALTWGANVAKSTFRIGGDVTEATAKFVANTPKFVYNDVRPFLKGVASTALGEYDKDLKNINTQTDQLDKQMETLSQQYKSGQINKDQYSKMMKGVSASYQDLSKDSKRIQVATDRGDVLESSFMTAADILSAGALKTRTAASTRTLRNFGIQSVDDGLKLGASELEKQILRNPAVRSLVERNISTGMKIAASETTHQLALREGKNLAFGLLIKRPLFYQGNLNDGTKMLQGIITGDYPQALRSAGWLSLNMINGGPLGKAFEVLGRGNKKVGQLAYGKGSVIDELSRRIGDGNSTQIARMINQVAKKAPGEAKEVEDTFRIIVERAMRVSGDDPVLAAENILRTYGARDLSKLAATDIYRDARNWRSAYDATQEELQKMVKKGLITEDQAKRVIPVRVDAGTRDTIADTVYNADGPDNAWRAIQKMAEQPAEGWGNNPNFMAEIEKIIKTATSPEEAAKAIRAIDAAELKPQFVSKALQKKVAKYGFAIAEPMGRLEVGYVDPSDTRKLVTSAVKGGNELFDEAIAPNPGLNAVANFVEKVGMSPRSSNVIASKVLAENVVSNLDNTVAAQLGLNAKGNVPRGGQAILSELQRYIENKKGLLGAGKSAASDLRQLTYKEIQEALPGLKLTRGDARQLSNAIKQGYLDVPLDVRGAGDKIVDALYRYNPLHKTYSRIQAAARYSYNPFFRVQERVETKVLSHALGNNLIWNKSRGQLDEVAQKLDDAKIFSSSLYGEAAQDQVIGRITANITKGQKRDLAGLAMDIANRKGMNIDDLIRNHPEDIDDALRVVVQYPRKGILASPLARTLNVAFFPMRYNAKVTYLAAKVLSKQPPYIQKAVLHSVLNMKDWLQSDEGIRWQSENQEAIKLLNWITPVNSITYAHNLLTNRPDEASDLGMLGGLPLGVISQILDSQGIINLSNPYLDKKTGDVFPKYIPETTKAKAATALTDLLGSMFTYPGRTLGLPGKGEGLRSVVKTFIDTNGKDFEKRLDESQLTELDRKWIKVLKGDTSPEAIDALYNSPAPGQFNWYTLPPASLPFKQPLPERRTDLPSKASTRTKKTKKIAQPIQ